MKLYSARPKALPSPREAANAAIVAAPARGVLVRRSRSNVNSTLILILAWILLATVSVMVNASFAFIPIFGQIIGLAVHGLCTALMALFSVHFYRLLLGQATPTSIGATPNEPPADVP